MLAPQVINDDVMGGVSRSRLLPTSAGLVFEGEVSLENGGGFASFRAPLRLPSEATAVRVAVSGDERHYRFVLRTAEGSGVPQYQAPFVATPARMVLSFMPADFTARFRGRPVVAPALRLADVRAFGVLISDGQAGSSVSKWSGPMQIDVETGNPALPPAVSGDLFQTRGLAGRVACYVAGSGPPLLLVHSVNAAASAAEVRPLHEHYRASRTVYSLDLPGFGASERSDRVYTPRLMTDALLQVLDAIAARGQPEPVDALAVSTGCEFLARAAAEDPQRFRSLALVSPTGLRGDVPRRGAPGTTRVMPWLYRALRGPGWGGALYRGLTRPAVIRYFLQRTWGSKAIDEQLWAYDVLTARLPGAEYAPLHFLSAGLFSADILSVYEALTQPVWLSHGVRGDFTDYRGQQFLEGRGNWRFTVYGTGALPYFEQAQRFIADYDAFTAGS